MWFNACPGFHGFQIRFAMLETSCQDVPPNRQFFRREAHADNDVKQYVIQVHEQLWHDKKTSTWFMLPLAKSFANVCSASARILILTYPTGTALRSGALNTLQNEDVNTQCSSFAEVINFPSSVLLQQA